MIEWNFFGQFLGLLGHGVQLVETDLGIKFALVRSLAMAEATTSLSFCWKSCPGVQVQSSHLEWIVISSLSSAVMMWSMVLM